MTALSTLLKIIVLTRAQHRTPDALYGTASTERGKPNPAIRADGLTVTARHNVGSDLAKMARKLGLVDTLDWASSADSGGISDLDDNDGSADFDQVMSMLSCAREGN